MFIPAFELNAAVQSGNTVRDSRSGLEFTPTAVVQEGRVPVWDLDNGYLEKVNGDNLVEADSYTHIYWFVSPMRLLATSES